MHHAAPRLHSSALAKGASGGPAAAPARAAHGRWEGRARPGARLERRLPAQIALGVRVEGLRVVRGVFQRGVAQARQLRRPVRARRQRGHLGANVHANVPPALPAGARA